MLDLSCFDFPLPAEKIARYPASPRDHARLLRVDKVSGERTHHHFYELPALLRPEDTLVLNRTRVIPARLFGRDSRDKAFEVLLLHPEGQGSATWRCLVRPGRAVGDGTTLRFGEWEARVHRSGADPGQFEIHFPAVTRTEFLRWLEAHGHMPLPPYIKRPAEPRDAESYQTVYAEEPGSVAAPTAGLHFTPALLDKIRAKGVAIETLDLQIGYGTFSPIEPEATELHAEHYTVPPDLPARLQATRERGGRVIAVGTTSLRALEASAGGVLSGETRLFLRPGHVFSQVDGLVTNFHLPQSSLFILICAFLGTEKAQAAYREALTGDYRFFSYGDAMAILA